MITSLHRLDRDMKLDGKRQHLDTLVDRELSAVTFVRDYVQLHFDGPTISAFTLPAIEVGTSRLTAGAPGYRDALCSRIGTAVRAAHVDPGFELRIALADGSFIIVSVKPEDRDVAEAAVFSDPQTNEWASW